MAIIALLLPHMAHAGAWNLPPGEGQIISTYNYSRADKAFTDRDDLGSEVEFTKSEMRVFYEHGLTPHVTAVVNAAHQTINYDGLGSSISFKDFDETELGLRYEIKRREGLAVSVQASYIIGGGPPNSILDIGDRDDSFELRGLWGQSKEFENYVLFFDAQAAIRARNTDRVQDWRTDLTLGWKDKKKLMALLQGYHTQRTSFGRDGFIVPVQKRTKLQASIIYEYKKNRLVQLGYLQTLAGRNIVKEGSVSFGTWIRY
ncbi:hypothetical protein [Hellea balneolensis]|uniref:hypothetical protein n=1 Tax=Hellea balneolensis TaxID=287478 RepID=UPI000423BA00|nr:hypothetical protein [Hellea balneolensis]